MKKMFEVPIIQDVHGGDIYGHNIAIDFSVNVNPQGMPKGSLQAALEGVRLSTGYPDITGRQLCRAIGQKEGVPAEQIILGNGAAELIYALCYSLHPKKALLLAPTFGEYERAVVASGGICEIWELKETEGFRLQEDFLTAIGKETAIVFLCNPNNPTGSLIEPQLLERIVQRCEETGTCLCLDECFLPFIEEEKERTMKHRVEEYNCLFIVRAFTKLYGMPGLRLGYALCANQTRMEGVTRCLQPWNTSIPAQMAGIAALLDRDYLLRTKEIIETEKEYLLREMADGLTDKIYDSCANYIFFRSRSDLQRLLLQKQILIRSCANYRNLTDTYFRIGIRTHSDNEVLIRRWKESMI
ncbi:MAG: threonine-phosphate decarboxylase [Lachnospiraceae bacterium]